MFRRGRRGNEEPIERPLARCGVSTEIKQIPTGTSSSGIDVYVRRGKIKFFDRKGEEEGRTARRRGARREGGEGEEKVERDTVQKRFGGGGEIWREGRGTKEEGGDKEGKERQECGARSGGERTGG